MKSIKLLLLGFLILKVSLIATSNVNNNGQGDIEVKVIGEGKPIILIPGLTCSGEVWNETVETLKGQHECHVVTLPGFAGNQPFDDHEGQYLQKVEHLITMYINKNQLKDPIIIGHSLGGFVALNIGIHNPQLPSKLVIVDALPFLPAIQMPGMTAEGAKGFAKSMKTQIIESANQSIEERRAFQENLLKMMITDPDKIIIATEWSVESDPETVAQAMYELYTTDIREELSNIKSPTLVLGSWIAYKQYGVTRESNMSSYKSQYEKLDGVIVDMTDKGKHFIMWDDPDFFYHHLDNFVK